MQHAAAKAVRIGVWLLPALLLAQWAALPGLVSASTTVSAVGVGDLTPEGRATLLVIRQGGPFPYKRDGAIFGNVEKHLPRKPHGHYREYTVPTPGLAHRGARRIVCGGNVPHRPQACWYTADHYRSFRKIIE